MTDEKQLDCPHCGEPASKTLISGGQTTRCCANYHIWRDADEVADEVEDTAGIDWRTRLALAIWADVRYLWRSSIPYRRGGPPTE